MLKTAVNNRAQQLWLEKEIPEARTVNGHICSLDILLLCSVTSPIDYGFMVIFLLFVVQNLIVSILLCHVFYVYRSILKKKQKYIMKVQEVNVSYCVIKQAHRCT